MIDLIHLCGLFIVLFSPPPLWAVPFFPILQRNQPNRLNPLEAETGVLEQTPQLQNEPKPNQYLHGLRS